MNTKTNLVRLAVIGTFSSLLWVGCASDRPTTISSRPVNLLDRHANTYPATRSGLDDNAQSIALIDLPSNGVVVEEAAGASRR